MKTHLITSDNKDDVIFTKDLLALYDPKLNIETNPTVNREIRNYIFLNFCNNDNNLMSKYIYRTKSKRGYRFLKLK